MTKQDDYEFFIKNIEPHYVRIVKFATQLCRDVNVAKDIAQNTMLDAWNYRDTMKSYDNIEATLITMTKNNYKKYIKNNRMFINSETFTEELQDEIEVERSSEDITIDIENVKDVVESFNSLDAKSKDILLLHNYYELPLKEIANIRKTNYNTVRSWHARAVKKFEELCNKNSDT